MCTGRLDLSFILRAFFNGADGVFIGGCWPGECHYITEGNYLALSTVHICKKLLEHIGVDPERLKMEYISASEGMRFAEVVNDFSQKVKELGPLGEKEGIEEEVLKFRLETVKDLIPYIKVVERERLRIPVRSAKVYQDFFTSEEFEGLFRELIADPLEASQIMALLREKSRSTSEISHILGLSPSEISRHLDYSARQGLVTFDEKQDLVAAA